MEISFLRPSKYSQDLQSSIVNSFETMKYSQVDLEIPKVQQQKLQKRVYFGYKRENLYDYIKSSSAKLIYYKISPIGIGKISTLRTKLEHIVGSIFDQDFPGEVNPCFDYIVQKLIYMELINSQKKTQYKILVSSEMVSELRNQSQEKIIKEKVIKYMNEWQQEQNCERYNFKKQEERIYRLKKYHDKLSSLRQQLKTNLTEYFRMKRQKIKTKLSKTQQYFFKNEYIEEVIRSVDSIQALRITHQFNKYNIFEKKNKPYFQAQQIPSQKKQSPPYFHIKINRPSAQIEPILLTVAELVGMRNKDLSYKPESVTLIKDIFQQIKKYQNISSQQKIYFEYLNPSSIIFDQISLAPKLSFIPLIDNLFGLTNKPMSLEDRILFAPTPKSFDYFRSFPEIDTRLETYQWNRKQVPPKQGDEADPVCIKVQYILNDPFYGNQEMFESDRHRMSHQQFEVIRQQKKQLDKLKEIIVSWRFLLTSYFLLQSQQFGFAPNLKSNKEKYKKFYQKMKEANQQLLKDASYLSNFLGIARNFSQDKPFSFTQSEIAEFLQIQIQDSVVQSNKYVMVKKYFQTRNEIIKEFIRLLVNQTIFGRIFNIKKYIFIYFTIAIEILEEGKRFIKAEKHQPRQRKKLRMFLEKELKRMKNDRNYYAYLHTTFDKIEGYRKRDPNTDHQAKFAQAEDLGKKAMQFVDETKTALKQVEKLNDELNRMENIQKFTEEDKIFFKATVDSLDEMIDKTLPKLKALMNEFIYTQLRLKHRDGPHRCPQDANKQLKESYQMYTTRLELLTLTYISLSQQNFISYDTMVLPQFRIDQVEKKITLDKLPLNLQQQLNSLKIVGDIIEQGKLLPKQMVYFTTGNKQSYEYSPKNHQQQTRK